VALFPLAASDPSRHGGAKGRIELRNVDRSWLAECAVGPGPGSETIGAPAALRKRCARSRSTTAPEARRSPPEGRGGTQRCCPAVPAGSPRTTYHLRQERHAHRAGGPSEPTLGRKSRFRRRATKRTARGGVARGSSSITWTVGWPPWPRGPRLGGALWFSRGGGVRAVGSVGRKGFFEREWTAEAPEVLSSEGVRLAAGRRPVEARGLRRGSLGEHGWGC
jgi:hypothetical protein